MNLVRLILAVFILFVSRPSFAQEWIEYKDRQEHFQINFPGQPTVRDTTYKSELDEDLPTRVYTAKEGPATYTLTVVNYKDAEANDWRGAQIWSAWQMRKRGGEVTLET